METANSEMASPDVTLYPYLYLYLYLYAYIYIPIPYQYNSPFKEPFKGNLGLQQELP